jgi:hypothetical protein
LSKNHWILDYSLRAKVKRQAGSRHPERNLQFEYLEAQKQFFLSLGWPILSLDGKEKKLMAISRMPVKPGVGRRRWSRIMILSRKRLAKPAGRGFTM